MRATARWLDPWINRDEVETIWRALADACHPTYFLSWAWVENWLATLPRRVALRLRVVSDADGPVAAWFIGARTILHGGVVPSRARFLNATGWPEFDELTIEHNGWLARTPAAGSIDRVIADLAPGWDELVVSALDGDGVVLGDPAGRKLRAITTKSVACHVVELDKVRAVPDYLTLISGDTRSQIRRSQKLYAKRGALAVEVAGELVQARAIFGELVTLHAAAWQARGEAGAFSPYLRRFHARLIEQRFAHGEIQLVRVRAGDTTLGCLYSFVQGGIVSFYQSGMAYEADNKLKPGLVCHVEAIRHNAAAGHRVYDFLGGDARYKRSLATAATQLTWTTIQRPRVRFVLEARARELVKRWRRWRAPAAAAAPDAAPTATPSDGV